MTLILSIVVGALAAANYAEPYGADFGLLWFFISAVLYIVLPLAGNAVVAVWKGLS